MRLADYMIESDYTVVDAIKQINSNGKGIVYVCKNDILCGSVTDGDVRRHILNEGSVNDNVTVIMNKTPLFCYSEEFETAYKKMNEEYVRSIPVLNEDKKIIDIIFADEISIADKCQLNIPVVIMAGGKGTRLYPYTQILPKPLIPIGEKTITEHIMSRFEEYGCHHFDMIVNYKKHFIKSYFLDNENAVDVDFIDETEFLGTGGGLRLLKGKYCGTFFMTNCDILIEDDYAKILEYHKESNNIITMVCAEKNMMIPYGVVELEPDGSVKKIKEKPEYCFLTNTGFYIIEPEFLDYIPQDTFIHITDVIKKCIESGKKVGTYRVSEEHWLDMGQLDELEKMKERLHV